MLRLYSKPEPTHDNCFVYSFVGLSQLPSSLPSSASYLPGPNAQQYQFVYVDAKGEVCSRSTAFTFSAPKPFEEMVTLEEEGQGEEVAEDMLLVIPRAQLLQVRGSQKNTLRLLIQSIISHKWDTIRQCRIQLPRVEAPFDCIFEL